jgi:hypothetical protein
MTDSASTNFDSVAFELSRDPDDDVTVADTELLVRHRLFAYLDGERLVIDLPKHRADDLLARKMVEHAHGRSDAHGVWVASHDTADWSELAREAHQFVGEPAVGGES